MHVTIEQALYMREALIELLTRERGTRLAPSGWAEVIDHAVYGTGKGLRMIFCNKTGTCGLCRGVKKSDCEACGGKGKMDEGRMYTVDSVFKNGERALDAEQLYRRNIIFSIKQCSIRTVFSVPTMGWEVYKGCPRIGQMLDTSIKNGGEPQYKVASNRAVFKADRAKRGREINDPDIFAMFEKYIRKRFVPQYQTLRVTRVTVPEANNDVYFINVDGEGKHFCTNKVPASEHRSNTIYFQCDKGVGICVRCYCPKPTTEGRSKCPCKKFKSTYMRLDGADHTKLFGEKLRLKTESNASYSGDQGQSSKRFKAT